MRGQPRSSIDHSSGFTFVEAVVAIALVAVVSGLIYMAVSSAMRTGDRVSVRASEYASLVNTERAVRAAVARVDDPYWREISLAGGAGYWSLPYVDGVEERRLVIEHSESVLTVSAGDSVYHIADVTQCDVELETDDGGPGLVIVTLGFASGTEWVIEARLGGWAL